MGEFQWTEYITFGPTNIPKWKEEKAFIENSNNNNKCHLVNMKRLCVDYRMYRNIRFPKKEAGTCIMMC